MESNVTTENLKNIFDLCDEQNLGYITAAHFEELARKYFNSDNDNDGVLKSIVRTLDPSGEGRIDFTSFCNGVRCIIEMKNPTSPTTEENKSLPSLIISNHDKQKQEMSTDAVNLWKCSQFADVTDATDSVDSSYILSPSFIRSSHRHQSSGNESLGNVPSSPDIASALCSRLQELEEQISALNSAQDTSEQKHRYMREENNSLMSRVNMLEEQIMNVRSVNEEKLSRETVFLDELIKASLVLQATAHKDKLQQVEILSNSLKRLEADCAEKAKEVPEWRQANETLMKDQKQLKEEISKLSSQYESDKEQNKTLRTRLEEQRQRSLVDMQFIDELVESLTKELGELRVTKEKEAQLHRHAIVSQNNELHLSHSQRQYLESQISRYKAENAHLAEEQDDLQAQLMSVQLSQGRQLITVGAVTPHLDNDLSTLSKAELSELLLSQTRESAILQQYIEKLTLRILEKNPSLLEISKSKQTNQSQKQAR